MVLRPCEVRWCESGKPGTVNVNEVIGDGTFRVVICRDCAKSIGVKRGQCLPEPSRVQRLLAKATGS